MAIFCSTIIPTIGRASLERAVLSVLQQRFEQAEFEVIVVNDSGHPLPPAHWQQLPHLQIVNTNRRERCFARNTGAAVAGGQYLHFLDDDDGMLPGALEKFWALSRTSDAAILYGGARMEGIKSGKKSTLHLMKAGNCFAQLMAGEWIPIQASLFAAKAFFAVGGFNNQICQGEDRDLPQRIALLGDLAFTPETVAFLERENESTTNYPLALEGSRQSREQTLSQKGVFRRFLKSIHSAYWHGRVVRIFAASALSNLRANHIEVMLSRAIFCLIFFVLAGKRLFRADFWRAVTHSHQSEIVLEETACASTAQVPNS